MIELEQVGFAYPRDDFRLHVPELRIDRGSAVALIGPSGIGKTTLLHMISGVLLPATGRVVVADEEISAMDDAGRRAFRVRRIGLVFQEFELLDYLNVLDNILLPYRISPALGLAGEVRDRAGGLAEEVGLRGKLKRNIRHLSQGERQRVAVCRALITAPPLLLCDEPTGNLDPVNKTHVLDVLFDHVARKGTTLVAVTHDHDLLPRFDRVIDFKTFHDDGSRISLHQ